MTIATAEKPQTLDQITRAEAEAQAVAVKAQRAAEEAQAKADRARQRAEEERARAYEGYLDKISSEWPLARATALTTAGEARQKLEHAVRGDGGDVFSTYLAWVAASVAVWECDSELAQIRNHHGLAARSTDPPAFNFAIDIGAVVDQIGFELHDDAVQRITDRRTAFVSGRQAQ